MRPYSIDDDSEEIDASADEESKPILARCPMLEKLKSAIEIEKQNLKSECDKLAGFIMPDYLEKDLQARFTLLKFAEAAVESEGKLMPIDRLLSPSKESSELYLKVLKQLYEQVLPAFVLLTVENTRLAAFEKRARGITESDIEHILTFTAPDKCAAAVLALVRECKTVAEVLAKLEAPGPEKEER